ncbi:MAG: PHP domain-containing protein [Enterocloster asparagiformis]|nr:PHP domain-containing protein [Enterocloster asparagiformis]
MATIDLHMHSVISIDGELEPEEVIRRAASRGIRAAALTDHNSVRGVSRALEEAVRLGIRLAKGVELDCRLGERNLHLLAYGIDERHPVFAEIEEEILDQERRCSARRLEIFHEMGLKFDDSLVLSQNPYHLSVPEDIAMVALQNPENDGCELLKPYRPGGARSGNPYVNFYWDYASQGKPAYQEVKYRSFEELNRAMLDMGAVTVIAHPGATVKEDEEAIRYMAGCGVGGMEVFSSYHRAEQRRYYGDLARRLGLTATAGSDFHGRSKPSLMPGDTGCEPAEEQAVLEAAEAAGIFGGHGGGR